MEIMDAQDKQWNMGVNFDVLHVYYHNKENSPGGEVSPQKRDYYALKRLIDDLERQEIIKTAAQASGLVLTGLAFNVLLKHLIEREEKGQELQSALSQGKAPSATADRKSAAIAPATPSVIFRSATLCGKSSGRERRSIMLSAAISGLLNSRAKVSPISCCVLIPAVRWASIMS